MPPALIFADVAAAIFRCRASPYAAIYDAADDDYADRRGYVDVMPCDAACHAC